MFKRSGFTALLLSIAIICFSQKRLVQNAHVGVMYPVSTNGAAAAEYTNIFSFHLFSGLSKNEKAFALSGITTLVKDSATGLQVSGIYNHIGGVARGLQVAGIINTADASHGLMAGGIVNSVKGKAEGVQVGGLVNLSGGATMQVAGLVNKSGNVVTQIGGIVNIASDVNTQIGGIVNKAGKVKGVQIAGILNIADSSDYPIGLINLVKNGERSIGITTDENLTTILGFRSGGRVMYGIVGAGYNFKTDEHFWALEAGLGAHLLVSDRFRVNGEAVFSALSDFHKGDYFKSSLRAMAAWRPGGRVEFFAGPSFNHMEFTQDKGKGFDDHYMWSRNRDGRFRGLNLGAVAGVQVRLN